jgi:P4 family phage/plasmid primase-like protien
MVCWSDYSAASIFARLFQHDRRIVYDARSFWTWNGRSWVACDMEATLIKSAFMCHMGKVKAFWMKRSTDESRTKILEAERARDASLAELHIANRDVRSERTAEVTIMRTFRASEKDADQLAKWPGPDVESVPIATRCLTPLKSILKLDGFAKELNANRDFLNTTSCAIHLPTTKLIPHHPSNMLSRETDSEYVGPDYPSPLIDAFMLQIQTPDIIKVLQMTLGYGITGHSREKHFVICYGPSNSGKTKLLSLIKAAIRLFYCIMDRNCVIGAGVRSEGAATLKLKGAHIAGMEETKPEEIYNDSSLKSIASGEGSMSVRGLHSKPVDITFRCLPIICTNSLPKFDVTDSGTLKKLPFEREFVEKPKPNTNERLIDYQLSEKIESPKWRKQMLAWLVRGSMAWYARGSLPLVEKLPQKMQDALKGYVEANDHLENFIADHCVKGKKWATHVDLLKQAFENYTGRRDRPMTVTEFKALMQSVKDVTYAKQVKI